MADSWDFPTIGAELVMDDVEIDEEKQMFVDKAAEKEKKQELKKKRSNGGFQTMGFTKNVYRAILRKGFKLPTPIQRKTIPHVLAGKDVVAMARTGSGKTAAFVLPMLEKLKAHSGKSGARALILSPTRELAQQTDFVVRDFARFTDITSALLIGGDSMEAQFAALSKSPDVLVAVPGRLVHLLMEVKDLSLKNVEYLVFDEADRLFEMGFGPQINDLLRQMKENRQTLLFSATLPTLLLEFTRAGLQDPVTIRLDSDIKISEMLQMLFFTCRSDEKAAVLLHLLRDVIPSDHQTIVFTATRHGVEWLGALLSKCQFTTAMVYGKMDQASRRLNVQKFRSKQAQVMIVTDVAARGIDIPLLDNVINFDFPGRAKLFIHRVGRVARAGRLGRAYNLVSPDEVAYMIDVFQFLDKPLLNKLEDDETYNVNDAKKCFYGNVPSSSIEIQLGYITQLHSDDLELVSLRNSLKNGMSLYSRTRNVASTEAVKKAKKLSHPGVHPFFSESYNDEEKKRDTMISQIKGFRPSMTIFEVGNVPSVVMKQKRQSHTEAIEKKRKLSAFLPMSERAANDEIDQESKLKLVNSDSESEEDSDDENSGGDEDVSDSNDELQDEIDIEEINTNQNLPKSQELAVVVKENSDATKVKRSKMSSFRDSSFFISNTPSHDVFSDKQYSVNEYGHNNEMVLDMQGDDSHNQNKQSTLGQPRRSVLKWDRKKKKYIRENVGGGTEERPFKSKLRDDHGNVIDAADHGKLYEKWQKKTRQSVPMAGSLDAGDDNVNNNSDNEQELDGGFMGKRQAKKQKLNEPNTDFRSSNSARGNNSRGRGRGGSSRGSSSRDSSSSRGVSSRGGSSRGGSSRGGSRGNSRGDTNERGRGQSRGRGSGSRPQGRVKDELRNPDLIRKERKLSAQREKSFRARGRGGSGGRGGRGRGSR